jgi:Protein of unknown function (DUF4011)
VEQREQPERASDGERGDARVSAAIDRWQRELLDLSRNNRLLYFQAGSGRRGQGGVEIAQPAPADLFDRLANRERPQTIARPVAERQPGRDPETGNPHPDPLPGGEGTVPTA